VELVMRSPRIVVVGEGMLELSRRDDGWRLHHGGDTLNTAIHLARIEFDIAYLSALGADPLSAGLRGDWSAEGLDTSLVLTDPARQPGLYAITTDAAGERSFTYWRDDSAARRLFELPGIEAAIAKAGQAELLVFSLISLAILPPEGRERLLDLARRVRAGGGRVAFDGNYRPRLWSSREEAAALCDAAIVVSDIGLPTLDDETALSGISDAGEVAAHWQRLGCGEVVVKLGPAGCRLPDGGIVAPPVQLDPIDTSGAGDAFNAGYLAGRIAGLDQGASATAGHQLAGWVVMRAGAIPPRDPAAPYS
jgi:2-dehydro-3-deoxygluconokinase